MSDSSILEETQRVEEALRQGHGTIAAGRYAASIMHEINNPLEAALNLNYLIGLDASDPDRVHTYCRSLEEQLRHLVHIARQTLSFYRPLQTREHTTVNTLADAALRVHQKRIAAKQIRLRTRFTGDLTVEVHAGEMLQVISNLIANAIDALPSRGILHIVGSRSPDTVHITVADNGHGIPVHIRETIFDPFVTTKGTSGTGLGLAISRDIIQRHKGTIHTRSSVRFGRTGTSFLISLPPAQSFSTPSSRGF
jgi:signal transduction histidine kinase